MHPRKGVDINEAAIDLPPGRSPAERIDRRAERRVHQHRSVDQHRLVRRTRRMMTGQDPAEKGVSSLPWLLARCQHPIQLADSEGREGAGKAGSRTRREDQFGHFGQRSVPVIGEIDDHAMLGLHHLAGRMEPQPLRLAGEIGDGDEQIERLAGRQEAFARRGRRHPVKGVQQSPGEIIGGEGRFEPARADEMADLAPHFLARFFIKRGNLFTAASRRHPGDRHGPHLGKAGGGRRFGCDQRFDIGGVEPQVCQRIERLAGRQGMAQKDAVDPPGARSGNDVGEHADAHAAARRHLLQQIVINRIDGGSRRIALMRRTAGADHPPDFLGDAVHVDGQADPTIADQRQP